MKDLVKEDDLTPKNRVFLTLILEGASTLEAYRKAGYKGEPHAAYALRCTLNKKLQELAAERGMDMAGLMTEVLKLDALPLRESDITVSNKLKLLKLKHEILKEQQESAPKISGIFIKRADGTTEKEVRVEAPVTSQEAKDLLARDGAEEARSPHTAEAAGSSPAPATISNPNGNIIDAEIVSPPNPPDQE